MSSTNLGTISKIYDPDNPTSYWEIEDKYAREQCILKVQKTMANSLPAKPTSYEAWIAMQPFLYYVPIDGQENQYQVWTLFFIGDPQVASDYTDADNYEWAQVAVTEADLSNFSTKGHTHEVITDVGVEDHEYTPQGLVISSFEGSAGNTSQNTHNHTVTPSGSVASTFSGSSSQTTQNTTGVSVTKTKKKLSTKKIKVQPATAVNFSGSTTNAQRATGELEALGTYDPTKAVFNGFSVVDGGLVFTVKKMKTANTVSGLSATVDASKVLLGGAGATEEDVATGALETDAQATHQVMTDADINDTGHTHDVTPNGTVSSSFTGSPSETDEVTHSHSTTPNGAVHSSFAGVKVRLKHKVDNRKVITSPDQEDPSSHVFDWYGIEFDEDGADPIKPRVGNMDMHKTLPIQSKMRRCILNDDGTVNYYLDDNDSTKRAGSQEGWVTEDETSMSRVETDDIRDNTEYIEEIKGNSVPWNQQVPDINVNNWTKGGNNVTSLTFNDDVITFETLDSGTNRDVRPINFISFITGHKYYSSFNAKADAATSTALIYFADGGVTRPLADIVNTIGLNWQKYSYIDTCVNTVPCAPRFTNIDSRAATINFKDYVLIDLTLMFGSGNEPTTVSQFESWLENNVGLKAYYPYNEGALINNIMTGVKTTFEGGSNTYPFDVTKIYGQLNGAGEYVRVFPNGMKKADYVGTVRDMLYIDNGVIKAVVNVGDVDLGDFTWIHRTEVEQGVFSIPLDVLDYAYKPNAPMILGEYTYYYGSVDSAYSMRNLPNRTLGSFYSTETVHTTLYAKDYSYARAADFKAAMSGVMLNYELATPLTYTNLVYRENGVDIPLENVFFPNGINVGRNGTVEILPQNTTDVVTCAPTLSVRKYMLQANARLDGSDGQVMVEYPEHWRMIRTYLNVSTTMVKGIISPYPQETAGWVHVKKGYISAYEASIIGGKLCSVSNIVDLTLALQDGKIVASCDVSTATEQSDITSQLPTTNQTMDAFRTAARARNNGDTRWNQQVYEQYLAVVWLYWIEYANLNSQAPFTTALDINGYHQGGLGEGATTVNLTQWNTFNGIKPFIPCGITNCLGNHSGEVLLMLPSGLGGGTIKVNSYRGVELFSGHILKFADGIKYLGNGTNQSVLRCDDPANYSSESSSDNYTSIGENDGSNGYKKKIMIGNDGDINCKAVGGSSNTYFCDYDNQNHNNGTYYNLVLGGHAYNGMDAGASCLRTSYSVADKSTIIGSRLSFFEK